MHKNFSLIFTIVFLISGSLYSQIPGKNIYLHVKQITENSFPIKLDLENGEFKDWNTGKIIRCILMKGEHVFKPGDMTDPVSQLSVALEKEGWVSTFEYSADGPDGTVFTYSKNKVMLVYEISWSPGHEDGLTEEEEKELEKLPVTYSMSLYCFLKQ